MIRLPCWVGRFRFAVFVEKFQHPFEHPVAFFDVRQFPAAEDDGDDHFIFVRQKPLGLVHLGFDIVIAGFGADANFLDFGVVRVLLMRLFLLLVFEFAEIHNSANRRAFGGGDFHQIQILLPRYRQSLFSGDDPQLCTVGRDDSHLRNANLFVNSSLLIDG